MFNLISDGAMVIDLKKRAKITVFIFVTPEECRDDVGIQIPWIPHQLASTQG